MKVTLHVDIQKAQARLEDRVERGLDSAVEILRSGIQRRLKVSNKQGTDPSPPGESPRRANSGLVNSIKNASVGRYKRWTYSDAPQSRILELGGFITSSKWMPVPISDEAKRHRTKGGTLGTFKKFGKLKMIKQPKGGILLVEMVGGKNGRAIFHYKLTHKVYHPPRPYFRPAVNDSSIQQKMMQAVAGQGVSVE